jgi:predicted RNase H-like nuclease (RuvC/YqgF family)
MTDKKFQLDAGLTNGEAHRDIIKQLSPGELLTSMRYNKRNGRANVSTRAFIPFPVVDPESDESKLLNTAIEDFRAQSAALQRDRVALDGREANALRRERRLDRREKQIEETKKQLEGERKELERQRRELRKGKRTAVGKIKSFFHRQT